MEEDAGSLCMPAAIVWPASHPISLVDTNAGRIAH